MRRDSYKHCQKFDSWWWHMATYSYSCPYTMLWPWHSCLFAWQGLSCQDFWQDYATTVTIITTVHGRFISLYLQYRELTTFNHQGYVVDVSNDRSWYIQLHPPSKGCLPGYCPTTMIRGLHPRVQTALALQGLWTDACQHREWSPGCTVRLFPQSWDDGYTAIPHDDGIPWNICHWGWKA